MQALKTIKQHLNTEKDGIVIWIVLVALRLLESTIRMNLWASPHRIWHLKTIVL